MTEPKPATAPHRARRHAGRRWSEWAARVLEVLWSCNCEYANISTARCYFCGRRPPRDVRNLIESVLAGRAGETSPVAPEPDAPVAAKGTAAA